MWFLRWRTASAELSRPCLALQNCFGLTEFGKSTAPESHCKDTLQPTMAASRTLSAVQSCGNCQHRLLSTFASLAGLSLCAPTRTSPLYRQAGFSVPHNFSTSRARQLDENENEAYHEPTASEAVGEALDDPTTPSRTTNESIPWYLQVQPPPVTQRSLSDRQRLPDLPADAPPLLHPILEHLSIQVGLDNLTLLDVRKLDPPPALGANLIMVIGTARSEKHLHVSADRFSRWLRTTHKLHPYADGLLGRNELKIKLRRKARRAKLLGSVGSSESGINADDGIRTGWVCVNVGSIEEAGDTQREDAASQMPEDFVGFSEESDGVKLVVQMLTEEKREELDLETLWGGFLARQQRKEAREAEKLLEEARALEVGQSPLYAGQAVTDAASSMVHSRPTPRTTLPSNSRGLHSSVRLRTMEQSENGSSSKYEGLYSRRLEPRIGRLEPAKVEQEAKTPALTESPQPSTQLLELEAHLRYLKSLPRDKAIQVLGQSADDRDSTTFLTSFYRHFPLFPNSEHWQYRFGLLCHALQLGHPGYAKADIFNAIQEIQTSAIDIPLTFFEDALRILASPDNISQSTTQTPQTLIIQDITRIMSILTDMDLRSLPIIQKSLLSPILEALTQLPPPTTPDAHSPFRTDALWRLIALLDKRSLYLSDTTTHYTILAALLAHDDWHGFWRYWRGIAHRMQRKPAIIYALMFRAVARKGHQSECVSALREWIPEMELEEPMVELRGVVAENVMEVLRVAQPGIERVVRRREEGGQWGRLWRRCEGGVGQGDGDGDEGLVEAFRREG